MLLHIRPACYATFREIAFVDLKLSSEGRELFATCDLITGRPYPNKRFAVACRKMGRRKAFDGILIETPAFLERFELHARWAIGASFITENIISYEVLDRDFDAISDDMTLWRGTGESLGGWPNRWPDGVEGPPVRADTTLKLSDGIAEIGDIELTRDSEGRVVRRKQRFRLPTLERERVLRADGDMGPMPTLGTAFMGTAP